LSLVLATPLAMPPTDAVASSMAPASPRELSEALLTKGDAAADRGDFDAAISYYRASYYGLSEIDRASYLGSIPVRKAMAAFEQGVARQRDPAKRRQLLQSQRDLLARFLVAVRARAGAADEVGKDVIAELERMQRSIDEALAAEDYDIVDPFSRNAPKGGARVSFPVEVPPKTGQAPIPTKLHRDWIGLGLTIGGSTLLATGLGVSSGWWTVRSDAQANVDGGGEAYAEGTQARADYLARADAIARNYLVAGSILGGIGLATAVGGVVRLVVHRRRSSAQRTALHVVPLSSPTTGGLVLHGRF
jgi:hypothetical protein